MRSDPLKSRIAHALAACLLAMASLTLVSAVKIPFFGGKPMVKIKITSSPTANNCGKATGNSLYFRVLQISDASTVAGLTLPQLWDKEEKVLGPALLSKKEDVIDAGAQKELKIERVAGTKAIVVVGNFCTTEGTCWRVIHPTSAGSKLNLKVDASCLSEAKH